MRTFIRQIAFGFTLSAILLALCLPAPAQQPGKIPRIGYVSNTGDANNPGPRVDAFRQGLRDVGYVEGRNILVEFRYLEGNVNRAPALVAELVQLKVDVLVVLTLPSIHAAKQTTKTIPIVMLTTVDPVATGLVDSLARPGGNITGLTRLTRELSGKRLELLKEVVPRISRVGAIWDSNASGPDIGFKEYESAARVLNIQLQSLEVQGPNPDLEAAFQAATKGRVSGLITIANPVLFRYRKQITEFTTKTRRSSVCEASVYVEAGCLMSYSASEAENYRRAAYFVDKILKGTKPGDIPVEQPTKFEFVINLKTAKALKLDIPQSVLFRADKVIK